METQNLKFTTNLPLQDITLEKNKELELYVDTKNEGRQYIKIINMNGELIIFAENHFDVELREWEGTLAQNRYIRQLEDEEK